MPVKIYTKTGDTGETGLFGGGRSRQVAALVDRIKTWVPEDEPLLIAGDFNDWNNRLAPLFVDQLQL